MRRSLGRLLNVSVNFLKSSSLVERNVALSKSVSSGTTLAPLAFLAVTTLGRWWCSRMYVAKVVEKKRIAVYVVPSVQNWDALLFSVPKPVSVRAGQLTIAYIKL